MIDNEPYWTLAESIVWICTRDFTRVSSIGDIRSDSALGEEVYKLISENTHTVVDPPDLYEIRDGAPKANWDVNGSADDQIIERVRSGSVRAIGRRQWDGPLERISPSEFVGLRIHTVPDGLSRGQSIPWLDVQFARADVTRIWPAGPGLWNAPATNATAAPDPDAAIPAPPDHLSPPGAEAAPRSVKAPVADPAGEPEPPKTDQPNSDKSGAALPQSEATKTKKDLGSPPPRPWAKKHQGKFHGPYADILPDLIKAEIQARGADDFDKWFFKLSRSALDDYFRPKIRDKDRTVEIPGSTALEDTAKIIAKHELRLITKKTG